MDLKSNTNLKYIGDDFKFKSNNGIWNCTHFMKNFKTGKQQFMIQQPIYREHVFIGYSNLHSYALTEFELTENFKKVKSDGSLEPIICLERNKKTQTELRKVVEFFEDMNNVEFMKAIGLGKNYLKRGEEYEPTKRMQSLS